MEKQLSAVACLLMLANVPTICCNQQNYARCPRGQVFNGQQLTSVPAGSRLACAVLCSETAGCVGVNVCPTGTQGKMMCGLTREYHADGCHSLTEASSVACFFMQKRKQPTKTTTAMPTTEATTTPPTTTPPTTTPPTTTPPTTLPPTTTPPNTTPPTTTPPTTTPPTLIPPTTTPPTTTPPTTTPPTTILPTTTPPTTTPPNTTPPTTTPPTTTPTTTTLLVCQNGGTSNPSAGRCKCPRQYGGRLCQRLVRDCSEVYENGYNTSEYDAYYNILPSTASSPIQVWCEFQLGAGFTFLYRRLSLHYFNMNYATMKAGFNYTHDIFPSIFIGLDNLHILQKQGVYDMLFFWADKPFTLGRSVQYQNFTVAPEADGYGLSYNFVSSPTDKDGFSSIKPVRFSAFDKEINGCATKNWGESGWYGADCTTYNGLFAAILKWPLSDGTVSFTSYAQFSLFRQNKTALWVD